jgi:prevent-host-death family protein
MVDRVAKYRARMQDNNMKVATLTEVKKRFSAYIEESRESPVVVTRNRRPVAMIVGIHDEEDVDALLLADNPRFLQLVEEARQRVKVTSGVSLAEMRRRVGALHVGVRTGRGETGNEQEGER